MDTKTKHGFSKYEWDIFISYAHVDNEPIGDEKWISSFKKSLDFFLARIIGRKGKVKIWMDDDLGPNTKFGKAIQDAIEKSYLFIPLISNGYIKSKYCQMELETFLKFIEQFDDDINARIFPLRVSKTERRDLHPNIQEINDTRIFDKEAVGYPLPYMINSTEYNDIIQKFTFGIYRQLMASQADVEPALERNESKLKVFLSEVADTLRTEKRRVTSELIRDQVEVIGEEVPPPHKFKEHKTKITEIASEIDMSIHILDGTRAKEINDQKDTTYPEEQLKLINNSQKPQLVCIPNDLEIESIKDENYKDFLNKLKSKKLNNRFDLLEVNIEEIHQEIIDYYQQTITNYYQDSKKKEEREQKAILIDTHWEDQGYAFQIFTYLKDHDIKGLVNPEEDDPSKNLSILQERLISSDGYILIYGNSVDSEWLLARLSLVAKTIFESQKVVNVGIYIPPNRDCQLPQMVIPTISLDDSQQQVFNPATIDPLIMKITNGSA